MIQVAEPPLCWALPEPPAGRAAADEVLSTAQVERFYADGFLVIHGIWSDETIARARLVVEAGASDNEATAALADVAFEPRLAKAAAQLLGVSSSELRLTQHGAGKKGHTAASASVAATGSYISEDTWTNHPEYGQKLHLDYGNNMLTYPTTDRPEAVACILYYSDAEVCGG